MYSVMGCGRQNGYLPEMNFTGDDINLLPKLMAFVVVEDDLVEDLLADVSAAVLTGKNGDGKIFVTDVLLSLTVQEQRKSRNPIFYKGFRDFYLRFELWYFFLFLLSF